MAKVIKGAAELAGEAVIAGAVVQPPGSMGSGSTGAGAIGKITQATVQAGDARRHADTARTSPLSGAQRGYLAVTEGRLLVMVVKVGFSQKADSILTEVSVARTSPVPVSRRVCSARSSLSSATGPSGTSAPSRSTRARRAR